MIVHLIDGTYELFRHFYGFRRTNLPDQPLGAVSGVLGTIVQMLEEGATHIGVATDHVIESFRNDLWPGYKTGEGIEPALWAQFHPLEEALVAMGVATWPMVELEADDALASAAHLAAQDPRVEKVCIWTPDKDLAQCVVGDRVVQVDRRSGQIRDAARVRDEVRGRRRHSSPTISRSSATRRTVIPASRASARKQPRASSRSTATSNSFPRASSARTASARCSSRHLATLRTDAPLFDDVEAAAVEGPDGGVCICG